MEHQHESAERHGERVGAVEREPRLRAKLARALGDLRANTPGGIAVRSALGFVAAALIVVSVVALGGGVTLALVSLVFGVAILVALFAARREKGGGEHLASLADRLDQSLESLKDLQWEVREREARYRDLLDHQGDVILRRDADQRLSFANARRAFRPRGGLMRSQKRRQVVRFPQTVT